MCCNIRASPVGGRREQLDAVHVLFTNLLQAASFSSL